MHNHSLTTLLLFMAIICLLMGCTVTEPSVEPDTVGEITYTPTTAPSTPIATATMMPESDEAASPTATPTPWLAPTLDELSLTATSAAATAYPNLASENSATPTPVPPFPGMIYQAENGLWQVSENWQPHLLSTHRQARLSPDGTQLVHAAEGDLWLTNLADGTLTQLTNTPNHIEHSPQWWPAHPDIILFFSRPSDQEEEAQDRGYLAAMSWREGWLTLLERDVVSLDDFAPSPNGLHIAYDRAGKPWLYHWDLESGESLYENSYRGEQTVTWARLGSPSWSSDGNKVAWIAAITGAAFPANGVWQVAAAIFDLSDYTFTLLHPYDNLGRGGWYAAATWSPDDQWLAFVTEDIDPARWGLWVARTDGLEEHYLGPGQNPVWSPDGKWLVYQDVTTQLVETTTWYKLNVYIYDNGVVVDWR
ncbi:MAG: PD40 domain-containing protein [Anaerolineae bacterium]|nr:PD40 domain-containing protein [Anaerolineae bacterium]